MTLKDLKARLGKLGVGEGLVNKRNLVSSTSGKEIFLEFEHEQI